MTNRLRDRCYMVVTILCAWLLGLIVGLWVSMGCALYSPLSAAELNTLHPLEGTAYREGDVKPARLPPFATCCIPNALNTRLR